MLYILEERPFENSFWQPYEGRCIISDTPWSGLLKRIESVGGWGFRWREISETEAFLYMVTTASGRDNPICAAIDASMSEELKTSVYRRNALHGEM